MLALRDRLGQRAKVPVARTWVIHALNAEGVAKAEICRILRVDAETVRRALKLSPNGASHPAQAPDDDDDPQLKLF